MRLPFRLVLASLVLTRLAGAQEPPPAGEPTAARLSIAAGDGLWDLRAEGSKGGEALAGPIDGAIAAYRKAIEAEKETVEARWRMMRALYFKGEYTVADPEAKKRVFAEGKQVGEEALAILRRQAASAAGRPMEKASPVGLATVLKGRPGVPAAFFWAGVDWGKWALVFGKSAAIKQGAAAKIRDYAAAVIAIDPAFEDGGGYRVLGRLHHQTPSVPFFTGWASRSEALKNLRLAVQAGPKNFINRLYLAEAMWDYEKPSRNQAKAMLEELIRDSPSAAFPVEDRKSQDEAKGLLATWTKS